MCIDHHFQCQNLMTLEEQYDSFDESHLCDSFDKSRLKVDRILLKVLLLLIMFPVKLFAEATDDQTAELTTETDKLNSSSNDRIHLDTVVVTASKIEEKLSDAVTHVEVVTRKEIEETPAENAADLLEEQSGIQITRSFRGAGIRLQGFDSKHILILVDGLVVILFAP